MNVLFWAIDPRVAFWTRFEANFRLGRNQGPLFLNGLASPRVPGQLRSKIITSSPSAIIAAPPFQFRWEGWCTMGRPQEPILWRSDCWVTCGILLRPICRVFTRRLQSGRGGRSAPDRPGRSPAVPPGAVPPSAAAACPGRSGPAQAAPASPQTASLRHQKSSFNRQMGCRHADFTNNHATPQPEAGLRPKDFQALRRQGLPADQPVTVLTDGGDSVRALVGDLPAGREHVLDWFHVAMRMT